MTNKSPFCRISALVLSLSLISGCAYTSPYVGKNPANPQFERGMPVPPLDFLGDTLSKLYQLLFWNSKYGNHRVSAKTEAQVAEFLEKNEMKDVKVRINQWAPHAELARLVKNPNIAWPYKFVYFPSTLISSLLGRPFSGLLISDFYDPASNTINLYSDDAAIALHESGHAKDFADQKYKGTYGLARIIPGVNLFQEAQATDNAIFYLKKEEKYAEYIKAPKILYPAYSTYLISYIPASPLALVGGLGIGHWFGHIASSDAEAELRAEKKWPLQPTPAAIPDQTPSSGTNIEAA